MRKIVRGPEGTRTAAHARPSPWLAGANPPVYGLLSVAPISEEGEASQLELQKPLSQAREMALKTGLLVQAPARQGLLVQLVA